MERNGIAWAVDSDFRSAEEWHLLGEDVIARYRLVRAADTILLLLAQPIDWEA